MGKKIQDLLIKGIGFVYHSKISKFFLNFLHSEPVNCVGWTNADEVYSIGDDHIIFKSNLINNEVQKITELPNDLYPTDMHWYPKAVGAGRKTVPDIFVLGSSEG